MSQGKGNSGALKADAARAAVRAGSVGLSADDSIGMAGGRIFEATLDHFIVNRAIFAQNETIESVHQMRVALRRLRAAFGLFRAALTGPALILAAVRAKTIASALGDARDGDVFLELLASGPGATEDAPDLAMLRDAARQRRDEGYSTARKTLHDPATTLFVEDVHSLIATRDWCAAPGAGEIGSVGDFARAALDKLQKRARRKCRDLATQTPQERHVARIALKKLRYAAEFFESLSERRRTARAYIHTLARLQDGLGGFNDLATANRQIDLLRANDGDLALAAGFVRGWFAHAACASHDHAYECEKRLKALRQFW